MSSSTVTVTVTDVALAPGVYADIVCEVTPDIPPYRGGHPDNWTPGEAGSVDAVSATVHADEAPEWSLGLRGEALASLLWGHEAAVEERARDLANA